MKGNTFGFQKGLPPWNKGQGSATEYQRYKISKEHKEWRSKVVDLVNARLEADARIKKAKTWFKGRRIRMHRLIMNAPDGVDVDHRDHDRLNNQKFNLWLCTLTENNQNGKLRRDNSTGYKGVTVEPTTGHYRPNIYQDGKAVSFGQFDDPHYAALARDLWAVAAYGEFANTNFPVVGFGP